MNAFVFKKFLRSSTNLAFPLIFYKFVHEYLAKDSRILKVKNAT